MKICKQYINSKLISNVINHHLIFQLQIISSQIPVNFDLLQSKKQLPTSLVIISHHQHHSIESKQTSNTIQKINHSTKSSKKQKMPQNIIIINRINQQPEYSISNHMHFFHLATFIYLIIISNTQIIPNIPIQILPLRDEYYSTRNSDINAAVNSAIQELYNLLSNYYNCPQDYNTPASQTTGPAGSFARLAKPSNLQQNNNHNQCSTKLICGCPNSLMQYSPPQIHEGSRSGTPMNVKRQLRQLLQKVTNILTILKTALKDYGVNNLVIGYNNTLIGSQLYVIGLNDIVTGHNIFVWGCNDNIQNGSNLLVIGNYVIFLENIEQIMSNPYSVINCVSSYEASNIYNTLWKNSTPKGRLWLQ